MKIEIFELTEKFSFDSAHRLAKDFPNQNIHGHSWKGEITLAYNGVLCNNKLNECDLLLDPKFLKQLVIELELKLENAILLYCQDMKLLQICDENKWKYHIFLRNPTNEVIAKFIYNEAEKKFTKRFKKENNINSILIKSVTIEKTCTPKCIYYKN